MLEGFTYLENAGMKKITMFGIEWDSRCESIDRFFEIYHLKNQEFGEFIISEEAYKKIDNSEYYKVLSLIYEQKLKDKNIIFSITLSEEKENLKWKYDNYVSLSIDEFLSRFPSDFIEKQQRILLNLYHLYPNYGEIINPMNTYLFFSKDEWEWRFFYTSMVKKHWVTAGASETNSKDPFFLPFVINDEGWLEIEKTIKKNRKKQVFIAMRFADNDNLYNAIFKAIDEAKFIPLRIDKKEHVNQITSEIQYEISKSGLIVADVTGQNQGVYFEAGYAMGLNIPVIWTCKDDEDEKKKIHFDTRQYNTIFWKDENDLCERLKNRIEAVMGLLEIRINT